MKPMSEQQFFAEAHISGGDHTDLSEAMVEFLRSHGFEDIARYVGNHFETLNSESYSAGCEEARESARFELEHFAGKLRSALARGDVDAAKTLIDVQLGTDEEGHQLAPEEIADRKAATEE